MDLNKIEIAKQYVELSNKHLLGNVSEMFTDDVIYESSQLGRFSGKIEVMVMMEDFFAKYSDAFWLVEQYRIGIEGNVIFDFEMSATNTKTGEKIARVGREILMLSPDGKIAKIEVSVNNRLEE